MEAEGSYIISWLDEFHFGLTTVVSQVVLLAGMLLRQSILSLWK